MSEVKFTKGEWVVRDSTHEGGFEVSFNKDGELITDYIYEKADAHLIAAAPAMYAMLQRWVDSYECVDDNYQDGVNSDTIDLLAKARGE